MDQEIQKWSPEFHRIYQKLYYRVHKTKTATDEEIEYYKKLKLRVPAFSHVAHRDTTWKGEKVKGLSRKEGKFVISFD